MDRSILALTSMKAAVAQVPGGFGKAERKLNEGESTGGELTVS